MKTKELAADNASFFVDKLGEECSPTQQLRELVQNCIDGIRARQANDASHEGRVELDFEPHYSETYGVAKLSISDNGVGMTADDLQLYINTLGVSSGRQALDGNFGVGARIAALSQNPFGVIYESWRNGIGHIIHMWRDPDSGRYGLQRLQDPQGEESFVLPLADDVQPSWTKGSGTKVVLLGRSASDNTCTPPGETASKTEWLIKTLNRRYFRFPDRIDIVARTKPNDGLADHRHPTRNVYGTRHMLEKCAVAKNRVHLRDAVAHWWLLPGEGEDWGGNTKASWGRSYDNSGHIAILVADELFLHRFTGSGHGSRGRATLAEFGITAGTSQVIIYVEPDRAAVNLARTAPMFEGHEPPWSEWGAEFREKMPVELAEFVEKLHAKSDSSASDEIRKRLSAMIDLFSPPRFRRTPKGSEVMDPASLTVGGSGDTYVPLPAADPPERPRNPAPRPNTGSRGQSLGNRVKPIGTAATRIHPESIPRIEWGDLNDELEDLAAEYQAGPNLIRANRQFRVFQQIADKLEAEFSGRPGARIVIWRHIESWFGQQLTEAVLGVQALATPHGRVWNAQAVSEALSEEALTVAVCVRYLAIVQIRSAASKSLGRSEQVEAN